MDNEMIERCEEKIRLALYSDNKKSCRETVIECIKAMREPTEKMLEAGIDVGPDRGASEYWEAMIDTIIGDE